MRRGPGRERLLKRGSVSSVQVRPGTSHVSRVKVDLVFQLAGLMVQKIRHVRTPERGAGSTHRKWHEKNMLRGEMPLQPQKKLKAGPLRLRGWKARAHTPLQPILAGEGREQR